LRKASLVSLQLPCVKADLHSGGHCLAVAMKWLGVENGARGELAGAETSFQGWDATVGSAQPLLTTPGRGHRHDHMRTSTMPISTTA
jgi:hypothetical protein